MLLKMIPRPTFTLVTALAVLIIGYIIRHLLFNILHKWAKKTESKLDDIILNATGRASIFWIVLLAIYMTVRTMDLELRTSLLFEKGLISLLIFSVSLVIAKIVGDFIESYGERFEGIMPITTLTRNISRWVIIIIGLLIILNMLDISITPILTALGVGGLAVALGLQDTLSNLFAGIYITISKQIRVGDYIKLDTGDEGYVVDIGWRATRIRTLPNNLVIIPNAKLSQSIITNYYLPEKRMSLLIPISVSYESDPERIERILIDEAKKATKEIPGMVEESEPFVRFIPGFGDFSLNFTLICQVKEFVDQYYVQHEMRKRIFRRFKEEGIEIPFPIRTVYLRSDSMSEK